MLLYPPIQGGFFMQTLSLSKKAFHSLQLLDLPREVLNSEGKIYDFEHKRQAKVLKSLYHLSGPIFASKLYTIEMLNSSRQYLPDNFYIPDSLISVSNKVVGFTIPKFSGITLSTILLDKSIDTQEKAFYLKQVGITLEQLKNIRKYTPLKDFYLNDLYTSNFMVNPNNREIAVIDLDSCKIASNFAFPSRYLTEKSLAALVPEKYVVNHDDTPGAGYIIANEESDIYCYIIMILNYLYGGYVHKMNLSEYYEYLNYLEFVGINKELLSIFYNLVVPHHNENPVNYIDSITNEQIYRAKESVFSRVRKNC